MVGPRSGPTLSTRSVVDMAHVEKEEIFILQISPFFLPNWPRCSFIFNLIDSTIATIVYVKGMVADHVLLPNLDSLHSLGCEFIYHA